MKYTFSILVFSLATLNIFAQVDSLTEAPHIFYRDGKIALHSVEAGKHVVSNIPSRGQAIVQVFPVGHPDWNFSVKLKKELAIEPSISKGSAKTLFISDIEGEFAAFRAILIANKVIDEKYNWIFGSGNLVICGDLFDRGKQVTEGLWLLYKLEQDAVTKGGYVHTILGNHDIMNLSGDLRYLDPRYPTLARAMEMPYTDLYSKDTELGRWLRTKNTIEKIGDNLCAHAGIAPQITKLAMPLETVNNKCRPYYDKARKLSDVAKLDTTVASFFNGQTSLFWYRGYFAEPKATEAEVTSTLALYDVKRIVVGHTIVPGNVGFYYGGKVLGLDVNQHAGKHEAALLEKGAWYKVTDQGTKTPLTEQ